MISSSTNIYVMGADGGPMKIGLARMPERRLRSIQTGHAKPVRLVGSWPVPLERARDIELRAHWLLRESRAHGEWFTVSARAATQAARSAIESNGEGEKARPTVGRVKINDEQTPARFPEGTLARVDAVLSGKEKRSDFIREAVEREIKRREKSAKA